MKRFVLPNRGHRWISAIVTSYLLKLNECDVLWMKSKHTNKRLIKITKGRKTNRQREGRSYCNAFLLCQCFFPFILHNISLILSIQPPTVSPSFVVDDIYLVEIIIVFENRVKLFINFVSRNLVYLNLCTHSEAYTHTHT